VDEERTSSYILKDKRTHDFIQYNAPLLLVLLHY
jgi:hypothetical protein